MNTVFVYMAAVTTVSRSLTGGKPFMVAENHLYYQVTE
jgi:hypothetical protein